MRISRQTLVEMPNHYRTNCINSLSGFKSANLIGTVSADGAYNLAIISSVVHLGANPALIGFICRPHITRRDTIENILATGIYTINHVCESMIAQAHQTSARYDQDTDEFEAVGLTHEITDSCTAPYVKESRIKYGLRFIDKLDIAANGTHLIIGEVFEILLPDGCIDESGKLDIEREGTVAVSGLDQYHSTRSLGRFSYAKPDLPLRLIP